MSHKKDDGRTEKFVINSLSTFIPEVKKYQRASGHIGKVILLLENAQSHPNLCFLIANPKSLE